MKATQIIRGALLLTVLATSTQAGDTPAGGLQPPPGPVVSTPGPNPAVILGAGTTPGDVDDRFIIGTPGAYRIGAGKTTSGFANVIRITSTNIDLNLDGFEIAGTPGAQFGIVIDLPPNAPAGTIVIRNGSITGFANGIRIANVPPDRTTVVRVQDMTLNENDIGFKDPGVPHDGTLELQRVNASNNTFDGINAFFTPTTGSQITANRNDATAQSGGIGISVDSGSNLTNVTTDENGFSGVLINGGSLHNVTANGNGTNGVKVSDFGDAVEIENVEANGNTNGHGVKGKKDTKVRGGRCRGNRIGVEAGDAQGVDTGNNTEQGLKILSFGRAQDSFSENNGLCGIELAEGARAVNCASVGNQVGVIMGDASQLWQSTVSGSTGNGIEATGWVVIDSVSTLNNGGDGVSMQSGLVRGCWAAMNTGNGIAGGDFLHVTDSAADNNGVRGFVLGQLGEISDCCAHTNGSGILVAGGSRVMSNIVAVNGIGIEVNGTATVDGNTVASNTNGIVVFATGGGSQITGNVIKSHAAGKGVQLLASTNTVLRNTFSGNLIDVDDQVTGNKVAPIQCDPLTAGLYDNWIQ